MKVKPTCSNCRFNKGTESDVLCENMYLPQPDDFCSRWLLTYSDFFGEYERQKTALKLYGDEKWRYWIE